MPVLQFDVVGLPEPPLDAAAEFHARHLSRVRSVCADQAGHDLVLVFPPASADHRAWRLAVVQQLARDLAPRRVNAITGSDDATRLAALHYLERAGGVTGQVLHLDGHGAGLVV